MKVLYVIHRYHPAPLTGSERVFATLAATLASRLRYEVVVVTGNIDSSRDYYHPSPPRFPETEVVESVRVLRLRVNWALGAACFLLHRFAPWLSRWTGGFSESLAFGPHLLGLERAIDDERPDLLHTGPAPLHHVYATWRAARKRRIPLVVTPMMHFDLSYSANPLLDAVFADAAVVTAFTDFEKNRLAEAGVDRAKIAVIPAMYVAEEDLAESDGASFRERHGLGDDPLVLFLGTKEYDKGAFHLLDAWPAVRAAVPGARLALTGLATTSWKERLKASGTPGILDFDYVAREDKAEMLAACNVLCVPSRAESFGIVLVEAWAKGKPVIGGSVGATREMITEGEDGYVVEFGDVPELSRRIVEILSDPRKQARLGMSGKRRVERWTEDAYSKRIRALYEQALEPGPPGSNGPMSAARPSLRPARPSR